LVLRESLGREEVEGTHLRIREPGGQDRQVVSQGLAAGSAGGENKVPASPGGFPGLGLMAEERGNAAGGQRLRQRRWQISRKGAQVGRARRSGLPN